MYLTILFAFTTSSVLYTYKSVLLLINGMKISDDLKFFDFTYLSRDDPNEQKGTLNFHLRKTIIQKSWTDLC